MPDPNNLTGLLTGLNFVAPDDIKGCPLLDLSDVDLNYDANGSHVTDGLPSAEDLDKVIKEREDIEPNGNVEENAVDWSGADNHINNTEAIALLLNQQIALKAQVVRAFRHLGLDVVRFFPE